ncbi:MAG: class I SAM-dependent methyltransferase [Gemmatimonadota bacterium]|nr:class I SAM-dependent methyltransferase [Gemmatimonadota bacterium]
MLRSAVRALGRFLGLARPAKRREHWQTVYRRHRPEDVSWYQSDPALSLEMVRATGLGPDARLLDVGAGASRLVDRLLEAGFRHIGALDISEAALAASRERLGEAAGRVEWMVGDVLDFRPSHPWDLWHDRAVFHFLVVADERARYREALYRTVPEGGHAILATFAPDGPRRCSGLPTLCCSAEDIVDELGPGVRLVEARREEHETPSGAIQPFVYARLERVP